MNEKIGALFDLDGVLVDTEGIYTEFWANIDRKYPTGVDNFAYVIKGNTLPAILGKYYPDKNLQRLIIAELEESERTMRYQLFCGVDDFLDRLHAAGISMAVVTSSAANKMDNLYSQIQGFRKRFTAIVTAGDVTRSKPDPQGYLLAAERLGISPERCIVFEDSLAGLEAGRRAGAHVVGLTTTQPRELVVPLANLTVDALAQLTVDELEALVNGD